MRSAPRFVQRSSAIGLLLAAGVQAQQLPVYPLGEGPWEYTTYEQNTRIRLSVVTRGLFHPWTMALLPGTATAANPLGDALISERRGTVRLFRDGTLREEPIIDLSQILPFDQLFDVVLHPDFATNHIVYFNYMRKAPRPDGTNGYYATTALVRARFEGERIVDLKEIFEARAWSKNFGGATSRIMFMPDRTLWLSLSHRLDLEAPQRLDSHIGKILRLNDDGSPAAGNPFAGVAGALPEIYSYGIRSAMGFTVHPHTGAVWEVENGPQGGDEVNVLRAGANYGWPVVSYGRDYDGKPMASVPWRQDMEPPLLSWIPSITVSSLSFYTGDRIPAWKNNLFVSAMIAGRIPGTGHLQRVVFNDNGEQRREQLFNDLQQRIRYVGQGPDGLLYLLTDENDGVLLRIEQIGTTAPAPLPAAGTPAVAPGQAVSTALFPQHDCAACHEVERRTVGPSYREIARHYTAARPDIDAIARRIIDGGSGNFGEAAMTAHSGISIDAARAMVRQILALGSTD
ncbi:MAG: PQQ-dependent sugar dehydrogenase [Gammaproteobacteria bacterium]|nr:PQQ-dependent sugar dehydrogenase [Gammaproteobacteria bacterium]